MAKTIGLSVPKEWEWVKLRKPVPGVVRVTGPGVMGNLDQMQRLLTSALSRRDDPETTFLMDANFGQLCSVLEEWANQDAVNRASRPKLAECMFLGAMVGKAELASTPLRDGYTHPRWHAILDYFESEVIEDSGAAGVLALNAAHRGVRTGIGWVDALQ